MLPFKMSIANFHFILNSDAPMSKELMENSNSMLVNIGASIDRWNRNVSIELQG